MLEVAAACLVVTALLAYFNHRFIGLPITIGVMAAALLLSLLLVGLDTVGIDFGLRQYEESLLRSIDFSDVLMQGMLSLLLFAGALHVDLKTAGAPKNLELVIAGESLFNDGVGVVIFSLLLGALASGSTPTAGEGLHLLLREAGGGLLFGLALGYVTFRLLKSIDSYQVEVLLTLAAVTGGYAVASRLHVSGPLAMVVVGLMIGNGGRQLAMSDTTRRYIDLFWELIDEILNAVLFVLIGMEVLLISFSLNIFAAAAVAMAITLLARAITVGLPVALLPGAFKLPKGSGWVLTWGGLRGGISVALALSLPAGHSRNVVLALTYCIVVFSILGQGLTIGKVVRWAVIRQP